MAATPERVIELLKAEIPAKISLNQFCKKTRINSNSVDRYMAGVTEPTQGSLEKLAAYFGVSVAWLRGGGVGVLERFLEGIKLAKVTHDVFNETISGAFVPKNEKINKGDFDFWSLMVAGNLPLTNKTITPMCESFGINAYWVTTGSTPPPQYSGGIVGTLKKSAGFDAAGLEGAHMSKEWHETVLKRSVNNIRNILYDSSFTSEEKLNRIEASISALSMAVKGLFENEP